MHQSGRCSSMLLMRTSPQPGCQVVCFTASSARFRPSFLSTEMNHWSVARKMTGSLQRQQQG